MAGKTRVQHLLEVQSERRHTMNGFAVIAYQIAVFAATIWLLHTFFPL